VIQMPIEFKDKIVVDCRPHVDMHFTMAELMIDCMSIPVEIHGRTLIIPVNIKTGKNWDVVS